MVNLDDPKTYERMDPSGMHARIAELPRQCAEAWAADGPALPPAYHKVREVVIAGMGGSAIGGSLLAGLVGGECLLPIISLRGYDLPAHAGPDTLVVASSYSGNTEETLSAFEQALERGCPALAVTTGGELARRAGEEGIPTLYFGYEAPPRAALGYSFTLLLKAMSGLGFVGDYSADIDEAVAVMEDWQAELSPGTDMASNPAKQLAFRLLGFLPVVYGAGFAAPVARRWKGQFNENAKNWACWDQLPELDHNAVVAYGLPDSIRDRAAVLMLRSPLDSPRIALRWEATKELLEREGVSVEEVWGRGQSSLAQMFSLIHFGDCVSLYLALLNGQDPSTMEPIKLLKRRLAEAEV